MYKKLLLLISVLTVMLSFQSSQVVAMEKRRASFVTIARPNNPLVALIDHKKPSTTYFSEERIAEQGIAAFNFRDQNSLRLITMRHSIDDLDTPLHYAIDKEFFYVANYLYDKIPRNQNDTVWCLPGANGESLLLRVFYSLEKALIKDEEERALQDLALEEECVNEEAQSRLKNIKELLSFAVKITSLVSPIPFLESGEPTVEHLAYVNLRKHTEYFFKNDAFNGSKLRSHMHQLNELMSYVWTRRGGFLRTQAAKTAPSEVARAASDSTEWERGLKPHRVHAFKKEWISPTSWKKISEDGNA